MPRCRQINNVFAFTLIELLIVVFIIGIISAVVIPKIASHQNTTSKYPLIQKSSSINATETKQSTAVVGTIPTTETADITVQLNTSSYIQDLAVYTSYQANFIGSFVFSNNHKEHERIRLFFPFPPNTTQASDVSLKFLMADDYREPEDVDYTLTGIHWVGNLKKGQKLQARVEYKAQGYNRYIYEGPGAGRAGKFKLKLNLEGLSSKYIPANTLKPTLSEPQHLLWDFDNLVTDRKIIVELPGLMSPMGRIILLAKLAGFAIFLFGAAFIYISELKQPGCLDSFRWGHFLLLALNYFLFFIIFMVMTLGGDLPTWLAIVISAVVSLPLLMLHVSRILDNSFAFKYVLPMSVYTLAIVFSGVYGGDFRNYLFITLAVIAIAFFTLTYKTWAEKRKHHAVQKQQRLESQRQQQEHQRIQAKRLKELQQARDGLQNKLNEQLKILQSLLRKTERLYLSISQTLEENKSLQDISAYQKLTASLPQFNDLNQSCQQLFDRQIQIDLEEDHEEYRKLCDELSKKANLLQPKLSAYLDHNEAQLNEFKHWLKQQKQQQEGKHQSACIACGFISPASAFCPQCGVQRAQEIECNHCGVIYRHPIHLLVDDIDINELHCMACGQSLEKY